MPTKPMKTFRFTADVLFDAEDIDHAIALIAGHFINRTHGGRPEMIIDQPLDFFAGEMEIAAKL